VPARIALFDNSASLAIVGVFDEITKIPLGEMVVFRLPMHGGAFSPYTAEGRIDYGLNLRELRYDEIRTRWGGVVEVQLEPDYRVFILRRDDKAPLLTHGLEQPWGFPLEPFPAVWTAAQDLAVDEPQRLPTDSW
jgi:hypothetical protein